MFSVPSLTRVCVNKIVNDIKLFCQGVDFEELGRHTSQDFLVGPLENLCKLVHQYQLCVI